MLTRDPPDDDAKAARRRQQVREAKQRQREREAAGLDVYWPVLPTAALERFLEAEGDLPCPPVVGREHVHTHDQTETALTSYLLRKIFGHR